METRVVSCSGSGGNRFLAPARPRCTARAQTHEWLRQNVSIRLKAQTELRFAVSVFTIGSGSRGVEESFLFHITRREPVRSYLDSRVFRSPGSFPKAWINDFYLDNGGVRGYQNRSLYGNKGGTDSVVISNSSLLERLQFNRLTSVGKYISRFSTEFFFQSGWIELADGAISGSAPVAYETPLRSERSKFYTAAGVSFVSPSVWNGQKIRFDFPV